MTVGRRQWLGDQCGDLFYGGSIHALLHRLMCLLEFAFRLMSTKGEEGRRFMKILKDC